MKKIIFNGRFLTQKITGVQRYAIEMLKGIDDNISKMNFNYHFEIVHPKGKLYSLNLNNIKEIEFGKKQGHLWEQIELNKYKKSNNSFLISLTGSGPIFDTDLLILHDVGFLNNEFYSKKYKIWYKFITNKLIKNTKKIITISNFSKNEIKKFFNTKKDIEVIYEGYEQIERVKADNSILDKLNIINKPFFFSLGSLKPSKNIEMIAKAAIKLPENTFLITGEKNEKIFKKSMLKFEEKNIIFTGYLSDSEIKALYEKCEAFIFPSLYEGFGLPPLEAKICGANLILSNIEPLQEIFKDYAYYVDPKNSRTLVEAITNKKYLKTNDNIDELKEMYNWSRNSRLLLQQISDEMEF